MQWNILSVWQPWASLMACGIKTIETRLEPAPEGWVGQDLLLHSSAGDSKLHVYKWVEWKYPEQLKTMLAGREFKDLPRNQVIAIARLEECRKTDFRDWDQTMSPVEDRWGWVLTNIRKLEKPVEHSCERGTYSVDLNITD